MSRALWQKLGYTPETVAVLDGAPDHYGRLVAGLPEAATFTDDLDARPTLVHLFATERAGLAAKLAVYADAMDRDGMLWVSWPKKSSGVETDMNLGALHEAALPLGLVDVKVCAVDATWTATKLMIRRELR
ncbi:MAG: DUF3052 domain-containing protein [Bacteroidota bacterium]